MSFKEEEKPEIRWWYKDFLSCIGAAQFLKDVKD